LPANGLDTQHRQTSVLQPKVPSKPSIRKTQKWVWAGGVASRRFSRTFTVFGATTLSQYVSRFFFGAQDFLVSFIGV